jgi:AAA ATPase containing von Willebrand factor type A (vWA) domain
MQNIQDLKEKIFFESKNIIDILEKIHNVDELLSKQDLVDELAGRISFLRLLEKNIEYFHTDKSHENHDNQFVINDDSDPHEFGNEVTEEEAIFNNELNEIDEISEKIQEEAVQDEITEEEAIFNNQLNEIVENEFHESFINLAEETSTLPEIPANEYSENISDEETILANQMNEVYDTEPSDYQENASDFIDEERILANAENENEENAEETSFVTEEEAIFNNQLNEINEFENEVSEEQEDIETNFEEEEYIQSHFETEIKEEEVTKDEAQEIVEMIPSIFDTEVLEDEILIEEMEEQFIASNVTLEQGEMVTETSNIEGILDEIKNEAQAEERTEEINIAEETDRRKIIEIDRPVPQEEKEIPASERSFENLEKYKEEKKIRLANIKGLKVVQTLFDDDPLEREIPQEKQEKTVDIPVTPVKEDSGSIVKTNIPTDYMEAEKKKTEFRLDLNDRIAFSKMLFGGSQSELNQVVTELNRFNTLDEAKEYLSDLYYEKNWDKVDEYAQRLWMLVENKFL